MANTEDKKILNKQEIVNLQNLTTLSSNNQIKLSQYSIELHYDSPCLKEQQWRKRRNINTRKDNTKNPSDINQRDKEADVNLQQKMKQQTQKYQRQLKIIECSVCLREIKETDFVLFNSKCNHSFCSQCLTFYIKNRIHNFSLIKCLNDKCKSIMKWNSPHYKLLTKQQQERYYKILINHKVNNHQNLRLCPKDNCIGYIDTSKSLPICSICSSRCCSKCLFPIHLGSCEQNGVNVLQEKFHFKKCEMCQMVVEKNQGCNHMRCLCGYQFCYLCGSKWSYNHQCPPKEPPRQIKLPIHPSLNPNDSNSNLNNFNFQSSKAPSLQKQLVVLILIFPFDIIVGLFFCVIYLFLLFGILFKVTFYLSFRTIKQKIQETQSLFVIQVLILIGCILGFPIICIIEALKQISDTFMPKMRRSLRKFGFLRRYFLRRQE